MTGIYRYVRHADVADYIAQGWRSVADLGPIHGEWSVLMWFCSGACRDGEAPTNLIMELTPMPLPSPKKRKLCEMTGVRSYDNGDDPVELWLHENGRLVIVAYNEAGYCGTEVDLYDLVDWLQAGPEPGSGVGSWTQSIIAPTNADFRRTDADASPSSSWPPS